MQAIFLYFVICAFGTAVGGITGVDGYYWRDYTGNIPEDAYPGGKDANRRPIYIGQVLYETYVVPAKIYPDDDKAYFEYNGSEHTTRQRIKILCTSHPEQFEWISTNNDDLKLLTDEDLVIGGRDKPRTTTYIGRVRTRGEIIVGKIITDYDPRWEGLHLTVGGQYEKHKSYQVLAYNPKKNWQ